MANQEREPFVLDFPNGQKVEDILKKADQLPTKAQLDQQLAGKASMSDVQRETQNLQNQINEIVRAPESGGDVGAEVYQARIGADDTNYLTLKARLDAEYDNQQSNIAQIADTAQLLTDKYQNLDKIVKRVATIVQGGINNSGSDYDTANACRSSFIELLSQIVGVYTPNGYYCKIFEYDYNHSYLKQGSYRSAFSVQQMRSDTRYIRIQYIKNPNTSSSTVPSDYDDAFICDYEAVTLQITEAIERFEKSFFAITPDFVGYYNGTTVGTAYYNKMVSSMLIPVHTGDLIRITNNNMYMTYRTASSPVDGSSMDGDSIILGTLSDFELEITKDCWISFRFQTNSNTSSAVPITPSDITTRIRVSPSPYQQTTDFTVLNAIFEQGTISRGVPAVANYRLRTVDYIPIERFEFAAWNASYPSAIILVCYDADFTFLGNTAERTLFAYKEDIPYEGTKYIKIIFSPSPAATVTVDYLETVGFHIYSRTADLALSVAHELEADLSTLSDLTDTNYTNFVVGTLTNGNPTNADYRLRTTAYIPLSAFDHVAWEGAYNIIAVCYDIEFQYLGSTTQTTIPISKESIQIPNTAYIKLLFAKTPVSTITISELTSAKFKLYTKQAKVIDYDVEQRIKLPVTWVYDKRALNKEQGVKVSFVIQTDTHYYQELPQVYYSAMNKLARQCNFDFIINLGDMIRGYEYDPTPTMEQEYTKLVSGMVDETPCPCLFALGNHDSNPMYAGDTQDLNDAFTGSELFAICGRSIVNSTNREVIFGSKAGMYYFIDFPDYRAIVLNTSDIAYSEIRPGDIAVSSMVISQAQITWFEQAINTDKPVIILSHGPLWYNGGVEVTNATQILALIDDFVDNGGTVLACIAGHKHLLADETRNGVRYILCKNGGDKCEVFNIDIDTGVIDTTQIGYDFTGHRHFNP